MAKSLQKKQAEVKALTDKMRRMKVVILTSIAGLTVKDSTELRSLLRKSGIEFAVAKKTLIKRGLQDVSLSGLNLDPIATSFGMAFGYGDEVMAARLLAQFAKTHEAVKFLGGILDGHFVDAQKVSELSKLPTRDELRGQLVGTIAGPLSGFINVMVGNLRGLARVIDAVRTSRAAAPAS
ncbi:MAG: 50S ribosomal protein L10 [Candidatus Kerfeldbacteria bacterium]|nr:50S ribosomal protein L10 [Candidatus Kerfeldbacteria bacterium]